MKRGLNKVTLIGSLGADPEQKGTIVKLSVATGYSKKVEGEWQDATEWHRVTCFEKVAEACAKYLKKGSPVAVEGTIRSSKYTDKNGVEKWSTEILAREVLFLPSPKGGEAAAREPGGDDDDVPF